MRAHRQVYSPSRPTFVCVCVLQPHQNRVWTLSLGKLRPKDKVWHHSDSLGSELRVIIDSQLAGFWPPRPNLQVPGNAINAITDCYANWSQ